MKRTLAYLLAFVPLLVLIVPEMASAAIWDPVIDGRCVCPNSAPDWGCVIQTVQNVMNLAVSLAVVIATLVIAYAGAIWLVSPVNPKSREMGRTMLLNAVIGLVVLLAGWIFVDFLMKQLYNESANSNGVTLGPWNEILKPSATGDDMCITRRTEFGAEGTPSTGTVETPGEEEPGEEQPGEEEPGAWNLPFPSSGINEGQDDHAASSLKTLLSCMAENPITRGAKITSISGNSLFEGKTWENCRAGQCGEHTQTSWHWGRSGDNYSYAVDFGNNTNSAGLRRNLSAAACGCNSAARICQEGAAGCVPGNSLHIAVRGTDGQSCSQAGY